MNPATVERGVAAKADSNFYTGGPSRPAFEASFAKSPQTVNLGQHPPITAMRKRRQSLVYAESAHVVRQSWKQTKIGSKPRTLSEDLVFDSLETTGRASYQILDMVGELAAQPRHSFAVLDQAAENINASDPGRHDATSFLSESGGMLRFADIQVSSDEDLIEAGYRFYSRVEDPGLAAESRRNFLKRIGLGAE